MKRWSVLTALLFLAGQKRDLNVRAAFLHMAADAGVSAAVVAAGLVIQATGWAWIDPVASLLVVGVIAASTLGLFRESLDLALDAVPTASTSQRSSRTWRACPASRPL